MNILTVIVTTAMLIFLAMLLGGLVYIALKMAFLLLGGDENPSHAEKVIWFTFLSWLGLTAVGASGYYLIKLLS